MKQHKYPGELGTYECDTAGFWISGASLDSKLPWSAVTSIVEIKDRCVICASPKCFHTVPRRFVS